MSEYQPGVDCIVVNWRTPGEMEKFLASFRDSNSGIGGGHPLHVVNNQPNIADIRLVMQHGDLITRYSENEENVGYARAVNHAARFGDREVIGIFNSDTSLRAGVLEACWAALMSNPDWGILGPRQVDQHNQLVSTGIVGTNCVPQWRAWRAPDTGLYNDVVECVTVSGSAYFVKREVWDQLAACETYRSIAPEAEGAFLPTPHAYEETWCSYHAREHGWKVIYFGPVVMEHRFHRSSPLSGPESPEEDGRIKEARRYFRKACDVHGIQRD